MRTRQGNPPEEPFSERLRRMRAQRGWSQGELARRAGLKPSQITRYEKGAQQPSAASVKAIAKALAITADQLLGGSETETAADARLQNLLSQVDKLPAELRDGIAEIVDALLKMQDFLDPLPLSKPQPDPKKP